MKIQVVKNLNGTLKPAYDSDYESFKKIPLNEIIEIEYKKQRNIKFHRKLFSLLNLAYSNQNIFDNLEDMRYCLMLECNLSEIKVNKLTGEMFKIPKSLQFNKMDEIEFNEVYNTLKQYICDWLGVTNEQINEEIEQYF
ncbi:MAG: protein of unknown function DUF1367 [Caudoviricetes sp.]|nr:MAG: protein of unknown function DUF1367 [Caudoviricetes sp.]